MQNMDNQCEMNMKRESDDSEGEDTLEAEISKLEATLHELDDNDLLGFCRSAENLENNGVNDTDPYEINEKTIYNLDILTEDITDKTITNTNSVVPTCTGVAESVSPGKQNFSSGKTSVSCKPYENERNTFKEAFCSDNSVSSSEFLSIHPTVDSELEALVKSPFTSSVQSIDSSPEFSPFSTFQNKWFTSSPKITNFEECHQSEQIFPSPYTEIQKLASLVSVPQHKGTESRQEQGFIEGHVRIFELQGKSQKPNKDTSIPQLVQDPAECKCKVESQSDKESSSDSVVILEKYNSEKMPCGSFLDLDVSKDLEKAWLTADEDGSCDSIIGPISSTPLRKRPFSLLTSKCSDFCDGGSFIVMDEVGEAASADMCRNKVIELPGTETNDAKESDDSVKEINSEPKTVALGDCQELNISEKHGAVVEHPSETVTTDGDRIIKPEMPPVDKGGEDSIKTIAVIKSDYLFKSEDPEENADNFDPEWEVLRKLQTDEERYKAMRERWRNLVIPDPNLDLTHHTWRLKKNKSKTQPAKGTIETQFMFTKPQAESRHKRTLSDPTSASEERSAKRMRTQSCTTLFDVKLQQLRQEIDSEQHRLLCEEAQAVQKLRHEQIMQKMHLQNYYRGYQFMSHMQSLDQEYLQNEETIRMQYKGARYLAESAQENKIHSLEKASAEVRAFHRFYQGLENKEDNDTSAYLSESQLEELWETENFYEECEKFYTS